MWEQKRIFLSATASLAVQAQGGVSLLGLICLRDRSPGDGDLSDREALERGEGTAAMEVPGLLLSVRPGCHPAKFIWVLWIFIFSFSLIFFSN